MNEFTLKNSIQKVMQFKKKVTNVLFCTGLSAVDDLTSGAMITRLALSPHQKVINSATNKFLDWGVALWY